VLGACESVLAEHDALQHCVSIEPRRLEGQHADLRVLFADRSWLQSPTGDELLAALREHPALTGAQRHRSAILLRFDDSILADLERRLAAGELAGMDTADALDGRSIVVGFVGPNTNKALHVGHLRNIVLGQALASVLTSAGATVQRHSLVGDIGRRVCEAMGGYTTYHNGESPQTENLVGDRFVELCSRDFPRSLTQSGATALGDPNAEERAVRGDLADSIMNAWLRGAAPERALWRRMRDWALAGHQRTLSRLGVHMDRYDFESEEIPRALDLIAIGLERGLFKREATGGVIHQTGRSEYTTMVLLREDGAPTEYARLLGVYHRMLEDLDASTDYVEVVGIEWQPATTVLGELLTALSRSTQDMRGMWAFHGSVTIGGQKMGSSTGQVVWIDDLLDQLAASPGVAALHEIADGAAGPEELADIVVRGTFLCSPTAQPLRFARQHLLESPDGPGWTIARAWCLAQGPHRPAMTVPAARAAIVQSQLYRRSLLRAAEKRDTVVLATYLLGLCEAFLAAPERSPAAALILRRVLGSLGFIAGTSGGIRDDRHTHDSHHGHAFQT
jgi:hypothetical protein